jgi:hypothetical protein
VAGATTAPTMPKAGGGGGAKDPGPGVPLVPAGAIAVLVAAGCALAVARRKTA